MTPFLKELHQLPIHIQVRILVRAITRAEPERHLHRMLCQEGVQSYPQVLSSLWRRNILPHFTCPILPSGGWKPLRSSNGPCKAVTTPASPSRENSEEIDFVPQAMQSLHVLPGGGAEAEGGCCGGWQV